MIRFGVKVKFLLFFSAEDVILTTFSGPVRCSLRWRFFPTQAAVGGTISLFPAGRPRSSLQPPVHELFPDSTLHSRGALSLFFHCRVPAAASVPAGSIRGGLCRARAPHLCKHELGGATSKGFARAPLPWMQTRRPVRTRRRKSVFVSFHWCGVVKK